MRMRPLVSGLEIRPGQTVELKPSSFHLMLENLKEPIQLGKPFKATLTFAKAGSVDVNFAVAPTGATAARRKTLTTIEIVYRSRCRDFSNDRRPPRSFVTVVSMFCSTIWSYREVANESDQPYADKKLRIN